MVKKRSLSIALASIVAVTSMCLLMGMRDVKAQSYDDLLNRIEALESRSVGNVTAPKIRGLKIGFEIRHRFEMQHQFGLTAAGNAGAGGAAHTNSARLDYTEDFVLQRTRIYLDADINKNVRGYVKLQDVRTWGIEESAAGNGTVGNLSRVDLLEGYAELRNLGDLSPILSNIELRVGRWQWFYGNHRLIGTLNWANESRSYDGARIRYDNKKNAWVDVFASFIDEFDTGSDAASGEVGRTAGAGFGAVMPAVGSATPAGVTTAALNGRGNQDEVLWGFYSHFKVTDGIAVEPYMINRFRSRDKGAPFEGAAAIAGEERFTLGARIAGKKIPSLPGVDFTFEQAWQFGDTKPIMGVNAGRHTDIDAFAGAWGVGYTFSNVAWSPRIGYQFAFASGDDNPGDNDNETFDHLYPTGHARMGYMDFHSWQNIQARKIEFSAKPSKKLLLKADFWFFEADEEKDAWYGVVGGVGPTSPGRAFNTVTGLPITDDEYGQELDIVVKYKLFKNFGVVAGYSHYFVDDYIEEIRGGDDSGADWIWLQTTMKF